MIIKCTGQVLSTRFSNSLPEAQSFRIKLYIHQNNYFGLHISLSFVTWIWTYVTFCNFQLHQKMSQIKSSLVSLKSEKYAFWVTLRLLGSLQ